MSVAVRLFVGNMPYGATEADLRAHFATVGDPSQVVIPVDRETGRPRGFAFVEYNERPLAEAAVVKFNQQPFMGRSLSVSEARPREERGPGGPPRPGGGFGGPRPGGGGAFVPRAPGSFGGPRGVGGFGPPGAVGDRARNFGPPKKKSVGTEKRWENKERGPKGPIKERFSGRMDSMYDVEEDNTPLKDFDDIASKEPDDEK
jgi:RNA recognition motif-containing protein